MRPPRALAALELKLPLLISGLLALVIGGFSWGAYTEVRNVTLGAAGEHLERVTKQLAASLMAGGPQRVAEVRQLAEDLAVRRYLVHPEGPARVAAHATMERLTSRDSLYAAAELWNAAGERVLAVGRPLAPVDSAATQALTTLVSESGTAIGPLRAIGDSLLFPVIAAVTVDGTRTGYVVNWRRVQASPEATRRFTELIGAGAALLVGNVSGDVWTDLTARVGGPPVDVRGRRGVIEYARPGRGAYLARAAPIGGTPWILVVELPRDRVLAPVRSFLRRITGLALALIAVGTVGAWVVSRRTRRRLEAEVAERARAEQNLLDTAARLRSLMDNASDGISVLSPDGVVLEINQRMSTMLGLPADQIIGRSIEQFAAPGTEAANLRGFGDAVQRGGGHVLGVRLKNGDGTTVIVDFSFGLVDLQGERLVLSIGRDVTEQRLLEQQFRQAQKMEAVGRLAGGVAHDFNNLLTAIFGYADLMGDELPEGGRAQQDLAEIRKAAMQAASLTRQLLAFSRQQMLQPVVMGINDLLLDVEKMLGRLIGEDVALRLNLAPDLGNVRADPGQLQQVVMNLVVNARDAMPQGGKVLIETRNAELSDQLAELNQPVVPGPYVMLAVSDTGIGMEADVRARIFEPFFTTKEKGRGTGLGLSTVYGIVKQSEGYIWVYSEPGRGTTFKIYLPRVDAPAEALVLAGESAAVLTGSETILVAEDDPTLRPLVKGLLERHGYRVLEAANAEEALAVADEHVSSIHLLITDVVMPGASGRELARRLAESRPETRVLYVSGYTDDAIVHHGMLEPGLAFLQKPFTPPALARKVREVLDRS